jgi:transcriptional regulator with XRE-family HTH domain
LQSAVVCSILYFGPDLNLGGHVKSKAAKMLRSLRLQKRLTQEEVAERLRVSQSYYSAVERGRKPADVPGAMKAVNVMRRRMDRTAGGANKAGREK